MSNVPDTPHKHTEMADVASHFEHVIVERADAADACAFFPRNEDTENIAELPDADGAISFLPVVDPDGSPITPADAVPEGSGGQHREPVERDTATRGTAERDATIREPVERDAATGQESSVERDVTNAWLYTTGDGFVDRLEMR